MSYPPEWMVLPDEEFETALSTVTGALGVELMAQVRPSGKICDDFLLRLSGEKKVDVDFPLNILMPHDVFRKYRFKFQYWAKDINIRKNMMTSTWVDVPAMLGFRECEVVDDSGGSMDCATILSIMEELDEDGPTSAALRWAVVVGDDENLQLQLQGLPASAVELTGKPVLRR